MVRTEEKDILIWGKCAYGRSLPDPFCIKKQDTVIVDVATVQVPCGNSFLELSLALTGDGKLMMCSVNISGVALIRLLSTIPFLLWSVDCVIPSFGMQVVSSYDK